MSYFHLAIPCNDLGETKEFYTGAFGARIGREYDNYVVFNFFKHQLVCHQNPEETPEKVTMYPRHFGLVFDNKEDFDRTYEKCKRHDAPFFEDLFERYKQQPGWHHSFFVIDPSNNLIELKYYENEQDIF